MEKKEEQKLIIKILIFLYMISVATMHFLAVLANNYKIAFVNVLSLWIVYFICILVKNYHKKYG